jgi:hypothetical protein
MSSELKIEKPSTKKVCCSEEFLRYAHEVKLAQPIILNGDIGNIINYLK